MLTDGERTPRGNHAKDGGEVRHPRGSARRIWSRPGSEVDNEGGGETRNERNKPSPGDPKKYGWLGWLGLIALVVILGAIVTDFNSDSETKDSTDFNSERVSPARPWSSMSQENKYGAIFNLLSMESQVGFVGASRWFHNEYGVFVGLALVEVCPKAVTEAKVQATREYCADVLRRLRDN